MLPKVRQNTEMTDAQRQCLSHVLRNSAAALEGFIFFFEEHKESISHETLISMLTPVRNALDNIIEANRQETYCSLTEKQCRFVAPFVGCAGCPVPGEAKPSIIRRK